MIQDTDELKDAYFHDDGTDASGNSISLYDKVLDHAFHFARNYLNHTRAMVSFLTFFYYNCIYVDHSFLFVGYHCVYVDRILWFYMDCFGVYSNHNMYRLEV